MRKDQNRTFYFLETENGVGQNVVRVGSDKAPLWTKHFASLTEALEAVKRRNADASEFKQIRNGVIAVYDSTNVS